MKIWKSIHIINSFWKQFIIYKLVRWNVECRYNGKGESIDEIENNLKFFYFYHNLRNHPKILSLNWHIKCTIHDDAYEKIRRIFSKSNHL